jgi:hypothetical protein
MRTRLRIEIKHSFTRDVTPLFDHFLVGPLEVHFSVSQTKSPKKVALTKKSLLVVLTGLRLFVRITFQSGPSRVTKSRVSVRWIFTDVLNN